MSAAYFVECLSRNGDVEHRYAFDSLPIRIGRGYDNELILDDEHIAANHAILEQNADGQLRLRDLGSRNGIVHLRSVKTEMTLEGHTVVRLGQTHLRVRTADFQVAPEVVDTNNYRWEGWPPALSAFLLMTLSTLSSTWLSQIESFDLLSYLKTMLTGIFVITVWGGFWSAANRLLSRQARFGRHVFIIVCGIVIMQIWGMLSSLLAFMFSWPWLTRFENHVELTILALIIYFHLCTIKRRYPIRLLVVTLFLSTMGSTLLLFNKYKNTGHFGDELYMSEMYSPGLRISKDENLEQFLQQAEQLKSTIDRDRQVVTEDEEDE